MRGFETRQTIFSFEPETEEKRIESLDFSGLLERFKNEKIPYTISLVDDKEGAEQGLRTAGHETCQKCGDKLEARLTIRVSSPLGSSFASLRDGLIRSGEHTLNDEPIQPGQDLKNGEYAITGDIEIGDDKYYCEFVSYEGDDPELDTPEFTMFPKGYEPHPHVVEDGEDWDPGFNGLFPLPETPDSEDKSNLN